MREPNPIPSRLNKLEQRDRFSLCFTVKTIDELIEDVRSALCLVTLNSPPHGLNITRVLYHVSSCELGPRVGGGPPRWGAPSGRRA